ncbi:ACT domain-containing protein [Candidatus Micrarchaeota archaeon]|nr:ACT domain-containing protein [Candidatus Micrarchaeota archaeon]
MKSITIVSEDRVGLLADISYILGKAKVNIESVSVDVVGGKAVVVITVKDSKKAAVELQKNNYTVSEENVLVVKLQDRPGELSRITNVLAQDKINIQNVHILSRDGKTTILSVMVDKPRKASKVLEEFLLNKSDFD